METQPSSRSYLLTRWLFLRLLGLVFLVAFASLTVQIKGLIGSRGIWPAHDYLAYLHEELTSGRFFQIPTIFWLNSSNFFLVAAGWAGIALSLALIAGLAPRWMLIVLWGLYLSFASVSGVF